MIPDIDLQLQVVIKSLRATIAPAVDPAHRMAAEQLGLSIATLEMVRSRLPHAAAREWQDLSDALALGRSVAAVVASAELHAVLASGEMALGVVCPEPGALGAARQAILAEVSAAIRAAPESDADGLMRIVVDRSQAATDMARAWSKPAGFEPDPAQVPDLGTLLGKHER